MMSSTRTYRLSPGGKYSLGVFGLAAVAGGLACLVFGAGADKPMSAHAVMYAMGVLFVGGGAWCLAHVIRYRVVLTPHALEVHGVSKVDTIRRDQITAVRLLAGGNRPTLEFTSRRPGVRPLRLPLDFRMDDVFRAWLETLPDAGAVQRQQHNDAIASNREFGDTVQARHAHVQRHARIAQWLGGGIVAAMLWALFHPHPYELVIGLLLVLPLAALALIPLSKGAVGLDGYVNENRVLVGPLLFAPGIVLVIRAGLDLDTLDWVQGLCIAAALAVPFTLAMGRIDRGPKPSGLLLFGVMFALPYLYGGLVLTNFLLDTSSPRRFEATVLGKQEGTGRGVSYELILGPWGPKAGANEVHVGRTLYGKTAVGDPVCIHVFEGRWKLAWYVTRACPKDASP